MNHAQRLHAADRHVAAGETRKAEAILDMLPPSRVASRLRELIRIFRSRDIPSRARSIARRIPENFGASFSLSPRDHKHTVVVFTDMFGKFWLTPPVLAAWLFPLNCRIVFLRAGRNTMFLSDENQILAWSESLKHSVETVAGADQQNLRIMGFYNGGFASFAAASRLPASRHLAFSIRSNLDPESQRRHDGHFLGDLRPMLRQAELNADWDIPTLVAKHGNLTRSRIVAPLHNPIDQDHAANLVGVPGIEVDWLDTPTHNTVKESILLGKLDGYLQELLS